MRQWIEDYKNGGTLYKEQQEHEEQPREVSVHVLASLHIQTDKISLFGGIFLYFAVWVPVLWNVDP